MFSREVDRRPLWSWVLCAVSAPLAQLAGKLSWTNVLLIGGMCAALCWCTLRLTAGARNRRWYCVFQFVWLAVFTGQIAQWSLECWPDSDGAAIVPLTLLVLAAASAWNGAQCASRTGSVVFWLTALLYAVVVTAGVQNVEAEYLLPTWRLDAPEAAAVFLLPAVVSVLPRQTKGEAKPLAVAVCIAAVAAVLTIGTLSDPVAEKVKQPFYEFSKSLSLFAVAERFEAFVSVALTMGHFSMLSFLLSTGGHLANDFHLGWGRTGVLTAGVSAALAVLLGLKMDGIWMAIAAVITWGILPIINSWCGREKNTEKDEKST